MVLYHFTAATSMSRVFHLIDQKRWSQVCSHLVSKPAEARAWGEGVLKTSGKASTTTGRISSHHGGGSTGSSSNGMNSSNSSHMTPTNNHPGSSTTTNTPTSTTTNALRTTRHQEKKTLVLPLHFALLSGAPRNVIEALLRSYPKAVQKKDTKFKRYPLHFACLYHPRSDIVDLLLDNFKPALWSADCLGRLPLHYASFANADETLVRLLIRDFPLGAQIGDIYGWIPLQIAVKNGGSFDVLKRLVAAYPSGLFVRTKKGSQAQNLARAFQGVGSATETHLDILECATLALLEHGEIHASFMHVADSLRLQRRQEELEQRQALPHGEETDTTPEDDHGDDDDCENAVPFSNRSHGDGNEPVEPHSKRNGASRLVCAATTVEEQKEDRHHKNVNHINYMNNNGSNNNDCVVCMDATSSHAFVPCGHLCICTECLEQPGGVVGMVSCRSCPVCRQQSFMVMRVFA